MVRRSLACTSASIANIFDAQLGSTGDLRESTDFDAWQRARTGILRELSVSNPSDVLLAYGVQPPSGEHRRYFHDQVRWLESVLADTVLRVWTVGNRAYHPSRWQRLTSRLVPVSELETGVGALLARRPLAPSRSGDIFEP